MQQRKTRNVFIVCLVFSKVQKTRCGIEKAKCVIKSPTESELVALTNYIRLEELLCEFVAFITNSPVPVSSL